MMRRFVGVAFFLCGIVCGSTLSPGRLALWSPEYGTSMAPPQYHTRDIDTSSLSSLLSAKSASKEALVILQHENDSYNLVDAASVLYRQATNVAVATTVYESTNGNKELDFSKENANLVEMPFADFLNVATSDFLNNNQLDVLYVTLTSQDNIADIADIAFEKASNVVIAVYERPNGAAPTGRADYVGRRLATSGSTNPEGTEFSIYYENTYLYLTPDIFTGLMTMLFGSFVLYTGYACLGAIQGPSTFANKLPALGKEG